MHVTLKGFKLGVTILINLTIMTASDKQTLEYLESRGALIPERAKGDCNRWKFQPEPTEYGFNVSLDDFNDDDTIRLSFSQNRGLWFGEISDTVANIKKNLPYYGAKIHNIKKF